jgi:hypothetical protein
MKAREDEETSLLDRRSYLKLAGSAIAATAASSGVGAAETETVGFGGGGYGQAPYGGGSSDTTNPVPAIDEFTVSKSDQLGDDRMFSVRWAVSDEAEDLDSVEVVVIDDSATMNFGVTQVSGTSASGWDLFQFPMDSTIDVTVRVKDSAGNVSKETKSVSL